jgi:hypothetical protein
MKISARTVRELAKLVVGDTKLCPYRGGPNLARLFNDFGANDVYGQNFPTRWRYAEEKIQAIIAADAFPRFITQIFDPREFLASDLEPQRAVEVINEYLKYDGLKLVKDGPFYRLRNLAGASIDFATPFQGSRKISHVFIDEQIAKCDEKLARDDHDGAITNARSLIEAVLIELEGHFDAAPAKYDGDLPKLYRRVQKHLQLDPARADIADTLKQILSGLSSIVERACCDAK